MNDPENAIGGAANDPLRSFVESVAGAMKASVVDTLGFGAAKGDGDASQSDGE